jgi:hypothetical protein
LPTTTIKVGDKRLADDHAAYYHSLLQTNLLQYSRTKKVS